MLFKKSFQVLALSFLLLATTACAQPQDGAEENSPAPDQQQQEMSYDQNSWKEMIPDSCTSFFDGCNNCNRAEGAEVAACTRKFCAEYQKPECLSEEITMYVGAELKDCVGVGPMECLQTKTDQEGDWQHFYDRIQGFEHQEGMEYALRVKKTKRQNPPADASAYQYELIEILSQEEVAG